MREPMLPRNYDNEVAVHRSMQIIWVYLSETPAWWSLRAATLHQSDNFTSNHFEKKDTSVFTVVNQYKSIK